MNLNHICKVIWPVSMILSMTVYLSLGYENYYRAYFVFYLFFGGVARLFYDLLCYPDHLHDSQFLWFTLSIYTYYYNLLILLEDKSFMRI